MADIVESLRDPNYAGPFQHLRSYDEIDRLFNEAADRIEALECDLEQSRSVEETTHGLYLFWQKKAQELAMSNDALRAQLDEARKYTMVTSRNALMKNKERKEPRE